MFHRHDLPRLIRDISNFIVYRKYLKKLDPGTREGRKWLRILDKNIKLMGFNMGVETFETYYEGDQKIGRRILKNKLVREVKIEEGMREITRLSLVIEQLKQANPHLATQLEEARAQNERNTNRRRPNNLTEDLESEFNIDISHVNRAMGNTDNDRNNDLDDLIDDIF